MSGAGHGGVFAPLIQDGAWRGCSRSAGRLPRRAVGGGCRGATAPWRRKRRKKESSWTRVARRASQWRRGLCKRPLFLFFIFYCAAGSSAVGYLYRKGCVSYSGVVLCIVRKVKRKGWGGINYAGAFRVMSRLVPTAGESSVGNSGDLDWPLARDPAYVSEEMIRKYTDDRRSRSGPGSSECHYTKAPEAGRSTFPISETGRWREVGFRYHNPTCKTLDGIDCRPAQGAWGMT